MANGLFWSGTRDHALLVTIISEGARSQGYFGRTALQKIVYFLGVSGVPMGYRFTIHHYGPYCEELTTDVEHLLADDVIRDTAAQQHYSNYVPSQNASLLAQRYIDDIKPHIGTIQRVTRALTQLSPSDLELMATLHYAYRVERARSKSGPWRDRVTSTFKSYKGSKFPDEDISKMYSKMHAIGLLPS